MFKNKKGLLYFSRKELQIITEDTVDAVTIKFDSSVIDNLDTLNEEFLNKELQKIESPSKKHLNLNNTNFILVLADDLVFSKSLKIDDNVKKDKDSLIKDFINDVPLKPEDIKQKDYIKEEKLIFTATNQKIYEALIKIFKIYKANIWAVYPEIFVDKKDINKKGILAIFKNVNLFRLGNYLETYKPKSKFIKFLETFVFFIFYSLIGFAFTWVYFNKPEYVLYLQDQFWKIYYISTTFVLTIFYNVTFYFQNTVIPFFNSLMAS